MGTPMRSGLLYKTGQMGRILSRRPLDSAYAYHDHDEFDKGKTRDVTHPVLITSLLDFLASILRPFADELS
jgi:hypothetical protein